MLLEVYYENYEKNCNNAYWKEDKVLPYMIKIEDYKKRENFKTFLINNGFKCVGWNQSYCHILLNLKFKKFALINSATNHSCVDNKIYSASTFISEILN